MSWSEDPDRALARWQAIENQRHERQQREDRIADYTPARAEAPRITSAMQTLAWTVLHGRWHDARDAARALAELVLEGDGNCV